MSKDDPREKLNNYAYAYGTLDKRTLEVSREVDKIINKEMKANK